jgi:hypothetical protein
MIRYHISARRLPGGDVKVNENGIGSLRYSSETRQNLRKVAMNIAKKTPYSTVLVRPRGEDLPEIYIRAAFRDTPRNVHHKGYSTEDFLTRMGLERKY